LGLFQGSIWRRPGGGRRGRAAAIARKPLQCLALRLAQDEMIVAAGVNRYIRSLYSPLARAPHSAGIATVSPIHRQRSPLPPRRVAARGAADRMNPKPTVRS